MSSIERDPKKRKVKPVEQACVLDFDEESSDDSDFRIEDHPEISDDDDDSLDSHKDNKDDSSDGNDDDSEMSDDLKELRNLSLPSTNGMGSISDIIQQATMQSKMKFDEKDAQLLICCGCLGDQSDGVNEIVECDGCGITVHEACYGISESTSVASTDSLSPTTPWFCESCKAGAKQPVCELCPNSGGIFKETDVGKWVHLVCALYVPGVAFGEVDKLTSVTLFEMPYSKWGAKSAKQPVCELCPNSGGIFKETDVGKWVHLVCALYVPGVAFGEVDKLTSVTLFEMPYSKWGAKSCCLCEDERFARTGVCIGCDAGMCRTYFHVTCAQKEGFLSEAHSEEVDQADPFYAHCKMHSDKTLVRKRKRNYMALQLRTHYRKVQFNQEGHKDTTEQVRIRRKLDKQKVHYLGHKALKPPPWVPTQKMPRLLTTSASACRKLLRKAELMGINTIAVEMQEAQASALVDIRKKWHIPPAFTVEFIAYYLDRNDRMREMKANLEKYMEENAVLVEEQQMLRERYDSVLKKSTDITSTGNDLKHTIHKYHSAVLSACATKNLPSIEDLGRTVAAARAQPMMVPTAAALKMGVGFPLKNIPSGRGDRVLSSHAGKDPLLLNECATCGLRRDQHLLATCDTCRLHYHLDCLKPPLARQPKKSKLYGWQCSECDKSSDSEVEEMKTPRRSRSIYSNRESKSDQEVSSPPKPRIRSPTGSKEAAGDPDPAFSTLISELAGTNGVQIVVDNGFEGGHKSGKKRRREKHRSRYSPDLGKEHKRKRKKKSLEFDECPPHPRITIKIKPIPLPAGEVASESNPQCFYVPNEADDNAPPPMPPKPARIEKREARKSKSPRGAGLGAGVEVGVLGVMGARQAEKGGQKRGAAGDGACDVCGEVGVPAESVKCDECLKNYHFSCLDPPLKKTPKKRGYSWHCADCDPTGSE